MTSTSNTRISEWVSATCTGGVFGCLAYLYVAWLERDEVSRIPIDTNAVPAEYDPLRVAPWAIFVGLLGFSAVSSLFSRRTLSLKDRNETVVATTKGASVGVCVAGATMLSSVVLIYGAVYIFPFGMLLAVSVAWSTRAFSLRSINGRTPFVVSLFFTTPLLVVASRYVARVVLLFT